MPFRFKLSGWQVFFLVAALALVAVMTFGTGLLYGVRLGEQDLPAAAGDVDGGQAGDLTAVPPGSAGSDTPDPDTGDRNGAPQVIYEIQLSSHLRQDETTPVVEKLMAAGYQAFVVETRDSGNRSLYTVRIGPWNSIIEAAEAADAFREHSGLGLDPKIRHRPRPAIPGAAGSGTPGAS